MHRILRGRNAESFLNFNRASYYSSVRKPYLIDDWFPWLYARLQNKKVLKKKIDADILAIDFVDIK